MRPGIRRSPARCPRPVLPPRRSAPPRDTPSEIPTLRNTTVAPAAAWAGRTPPISAARLGAWNSHAATPTRGQAQYQVQQRCRWVDEGEGGQAEREEGQSGHHHAGAPTPSTAISLVSIAQPGSPSVPALHVGESVGREGLPPRRVNGPSCGRRTYRFCADRGYSVRCRRGGVRRAWLSRAAPDRPRSGRARRDSASPSC